MNDSGAKHASRHFRTVTGFDQFSADVPHAKGKDPLGGHEAVAFRARDFKKEAAVFVKGLTGWDLDGCPKFVGFTRDLGVGGSNNNVSGEGILAEHEFKSGVEFFRGHFPSDKSPFREIRCKECLANPPDRSGLEHRTNALKNHRELNAAPTRDFQEWLAGEPRNFILRNG